MQTKNLLIKAFIGIFIALLIYPNTSLFNEKKNAAIVARENRKITAFPKESLKQKTFYTNFEKWYQDRLRSREIARKQWARLNFSLGILSKDGYFLGKDGWLFAKGNIIKNFRDTKEKVASLKKLQTYCESKGKKFILLVPPTKEAAYSSYFPKHIQKLYKDFSIFEKQAEDLFRQNKINFLPTGEVLAEAISKNKEDFYFHDDHHWSYYGAAVASDLLLTKIQSEIGKPFYNGLKLDGSTREAFKEVSYANALSLNYSRKTVAPWSKTYQDTICVTDCYTGKEIKLNKVLSNDTLWGRIVKGEAIIENKAITNGITILVLGDSYSSYMMPYLSQNVQKIISTHYREKGEKKKNTDMKRLIEKYNPDVVVLEMLANTFFHSSKDNNFKNIVY